MSQGEIRLRPSVQGNKLIKEGCRDNGLALEHPEARRDELLEAEILGNLKGVLCRMENLDPVQSKVPEVASDMALANQVKIVEEPDSARIQFLSCLLVWPVDAQKLRHLE